MDAQDTEPDCWIVCDLAHLLCESWKRLDDADSQGMGDALLACAHARHDLMLACWYDDED